MCLLILLLLLCCMCSTEFAEGSIEIRCWCAHRKSAHVGQEGSPAPLFPEMTKSSLLRRPDELLWLHYREHPCQLHYSLVGELLRLGPEGAAEGGENRPAHRRESLPAIGDINRKRCLRRVMVVSNDSLHPIYRITTFRFMFLPL